jgi:DNA polymerase-3 subunit delta
MARSGSPKRLVGIRLSEFLKHPEAAPKPIYVLLGSDPYLLDQGRRAVRRQVLADADPGMALLELGGEEAVLADVLDALRTPPFLAPRRLVSIREAEKFLGQKGGGGEDEGAESPAADGKKVREALLRYLEAPAPTGSLCLEVASWNESTSLAKRVAAVGCVICCEVTEPGTLPGWLQRETRSRYHKTLTYAAAQMLLEYLGTDMAALLAALDALALFTESATAIDAPDVDSVIARGHHDRVWALSDAVAERRIPRALELLDAFWAEGMVAPQIVGLLRSTFRQLIRTKALARRMSLDAAMAQANVFYGAQDRVRRALAAFSVEHLAGAYQALVDTDLEAKTTPNDRLAMETLVHRLCRPEAARDAESLARASSD